MPSSTQWRVYVTATNGGVPGIATCEMRSSIAGANECAGGTASASSVYPFGSYVAANAFDGNASTFWDANVSVPGWLQYTFASAKSIVEFTIQAPPGGNVNDVPRDFLLQYFDGSTWVSVYSLVAEAGWSAGQTRTYSASNPPAGSTWRLYVTAMQAGFPGMAELQMHTTVGGADQCTGGTASASSIYLNSATYNADKAFDGNASTFWDANAAPPQWIAYTFGTAKSIVEYVIKAPPSGNETNAPRSFVLQHNDGVGGWIDFDAGESNVPNWTAGESRTYPFVASARQSDFFF